MQSRTSDVVVIGGGLSGLTAAFCMLDKDPKLKVTVLEAKDRLGGRTLTKQLRSADGELDFWDVGGEWIGRPQPHLQHLLKTFQIDTFTLQNADSEYVSSHKPGILTQIDLYIFVWRLRRLRQKFLHLGDRVFSSVAAFQCDGVIFKDYYEETLWTLDAKEAVLAVCRFMFGLHPSEMSLMYFLMHVESAGGLESLLAPHHFSGKEHRAKGGIQQICNHLIKRIGKNNILKKQPVTHVVQSDDRVTVVTSERVQIQCWRVVVAVPPQHLLSIQFTPCLPSDKVNILQNIPLAHIVKFVFTYDEAFWTREAAEGVHGFQMVLEDDKDGPVGVVYDGTSSRGNPALVGFVSCSKGPAKSEDPREQRDAILQLLEDLLGPSVRSSIDSCVFDWSQEQYNGGCFLKSFMPSFMRFFTQTLREPHDRIHFGGTETGTVWCGLMNGAVQAGCRTAAEVLFHLRPDLVEETDCSGDIVTHRDPYPNSPFSSPWIILGVGVCVVGVMLIASFRQKFESNVIPLQLVTDWK